MNRIRWLIMLVSCGVLLVLSGCDFMKDPKLLIQPPRLSSDKQSLTSVINSYLNHLPSGGSIIRPREVGDASSIRVQDLDNDGRDEAVVFYETPDEAIRIHGVIFENEDKTWVPVATFDGEGQVLESVNLKDLRNDSSTELVVGYSNGDKEVQKGLAVYSFKNNKVEKILELPYSNFVIDDLNGDGKLDLTVLSFKKNEYSTLTVYQSKENSFEQLDQLELDANVNDYYNVVAGQVTTDKKQGIILDASLSSNTAYSLLVMMEDGKLVQKLPSQDTAFKDYPIVSEDVNKDGILEIGTMEKPQGWDGFSFEDIPWLFNFYQWDDKKGLKFVMQQYMDLEGRFFYTFPSELYGKITIDTKSDKNHYLRFVRTDNNETITEIKFFTLAQWERVGKDWKELDRTSDSVIGYRSDYDLKVSKSEKEIKR